MKEFYCGTKIVCGSGAVAHLKELGCRKLFVVSDPYFADNGKAAAIGKLSGAQQVEIFRDIKPDPTVELVAGGTAALKRFGPDAVVALGGGSAMDCAKAMLYFSGLDAKLVAIPTTSGSGSEVTDFSILTHEGVKHPLVDERLTPYMAILDDELLQQLPSSLVADTGFDVLAHALEGLVAKNATDFTDALAQKAFCMAAEALSASFAGELRVRMQMHVAATMAGIAFTRAGLGLCHAMSHVLGGIYHVPHGRLNAILLPSVIGVNALAAGHQYANLARSAGIGGSSDVMAVRALRNALTKLRRQLQLPTDLAQAGVDTAAVRKDVEKIVTAVLQDPCCGTNPVEVTALMVHGVLEEVIGGG